MDKNKDNKRQYFGIDVGKANLDVRLPDGEHWVLSNDKQGLRKLLRAVNKTGGGFCVFEASGGYEKLLRASLEDAGLPFLLANPFHLRQFAKCQGILAKTDKIDSKVLQDYGAFKQMETPPSNKEVGALRVLVERRRQLKDHLVQEKNHLEHGDSTINGSIRRMIRFLEKEVAKVEEAIESQVMGSPDLQMRRAVLLQVKGIGNVVAVTLLAYLPELGSIGRKQVAALAGLAPYAHDSGKLKGKRFLHGGRRRVRSAMYMAVLTAARHNPDLQPFVERLKNKPKKTVLLACARKLLVQLNAKVRDALMEESLLVAA